MLIAEIPLEKNGKLNDRSVICFECIEFFINIDQHSDSIELDDELIQINQTTIETKILEVHVLTPFFIVYFFARLLFVVHNVYLCLFPANLLRNSCER